jgi:hypothetical protein
MTFQSHFRTDSVAHLCDGPSMQDAITIVNPWHLSSGQPHHISFLGICSYLWYSAAPHPIWIITWGYLIIAKLPSLSHYCPYITSVPIMTLFPSCNFVLMFPQLPYRYIKDIEYSLYSLDLDILNIQPIVYPWVQSWDHCTLLLMWLGIVAT